MNDRTEVMKNSSLAFFVAEINKILDKMETTLKAGSPFLVGDKYTMADVIGTVMIARIMAVDRHDILPENVKAYWERMKQREAFAKADLWYNWDDSLAEQNHKAWRKKFFAKLCIGISLITLVTIGIVVV